MRRWSVSLAVAATLLLHGCGSQEMMANTPQCADNNSTIALEVIPSKFARADHTTISVRWQSYMELTGFVVATLVVGEEQQIDVEVELHGQDVASEFIYVGELLNPFGAGAPAGTAAVVAVAEASNGCRVVPTATTSFELE